MRLVQLNRDELLKPLQAVTGIVERRHTLPILSNVLIERNQEQVSLTATDLEIQIVTCFAAEKSEGESTRLTVSARKLQDILRALPENADAVLDAQNNRLQVRSGKSRFNLQTLPAADFPTFAELGTPEVKITIPQKELKQLLLLVHYAMAQQDIRYYLNGVLLVIEDNQLKVVATDGHRLSYAAGRQQQQGAKREVIIPRKAVLELSKQLMDSEQEVDVEIYANQVRF